MIYSLFFSTAILMIALKMLAVYFQQYQVVPAPLKEDAPVSRPAFPWKFFPGILVKIVTFQKLKWVIRTKKGDRVGAIQRGLGFFLGVLLITSGFYGFVQLQLDLLEGRITDASTIREIEVAMGKLDGIRASYFKLPGWADWSLLILLIVFGPLMPVIQKWKLDKGYKNFKKVTWRASTILHVAGSFTFFGIVVEKEKEGIAENLEMHKLQIIAGEKSLRKQITALITENAVNSFLQEPMVQQVLEQSEKTQEKLDKQLDDENFQELVKLKPGYSPLSKQRDYFNSERNINSILGHIEAGIDAERAKSADVNPSGETQEAPGHAKDLSVKKIRDAEERIKKIRKSNPSWFMRAAVKTKYHDLLQKIVGSMYDPTVGKNIEKIITSATGEIPFISYFLDPLVNEPVKESINRKVNQVADALLKGDWQTAETTLEATMKSAASGTGLKAQAPEYKYNVVQQMEVASGMADILPEIIREDLEDTKKAIRSQSASLDPDIISNSTHPKARIDPEIPTVKKWEDLWGKTVVHYEKLPAKTNVAGIIAHERPSGWKAIWKALSHIR